MDKVNELELKIIELIQKENITDDPIEKQKVLLERVNLECEVLQCKYMMEKDMYISRLIEQQIKNNEEYYDKMLKYLHYLEDSKIEKVQREQEYQWKLHELELRQQILNLQAQEQECCVIS